MMKCLSCIAALATIAGAHSDHEQKPIAGPHKSLWYNTFDNIPGDGGTQVSSVLSSGVNGLIVTASGRFRLFWHLHLRASAILSMLRQ